MKCRCIRMGALAAMLSTMVPNQVHAAQTLRVQVKQRGDFLLIGNTLGHECADGTPQPIVGDVGNCGTMSSCEDSAPDVFWRSEAPGAGQAQANNTIAIAQARSTAVLNIPPMATVTHAFLYWGATIVGGDMTAILDRPGGFSQDITAVQMYTSTFNSYQSVADITAIVKVQGSGAYRMSGVDSVNIVESINSNTFAGWWMVVFYQLKSDPPRNLALFDGFDEVRNNAPQNLTLSGFLVPNAFNSAKLGVVAFEGDNAYTGDSFSFGPAPALTDANNPANNFFNGTHSLVGMPVTTVGDLPQLAGTPQSMSGIDIDVVDVTSKLVGGQTSVPISATSVGDVYYLAGFVTSIPTFEPNFSTSRKTAADLNGGIVLPGDTIEYTIDVTNTGNDPSIKTVLTDALPMGVTYVQGTIQVTSGANTGAKTDAMGDDQGEYDGASRTITVRLGTSANGMQGGVMAVNDTTKVTFLVTIDANVTGIIANQATITAESQASALPVNTPTDADGTGIGAPTEIVVNKCAVPIGETGPKPDGSSCTNGICQTAADCRPDPAFFDCVDNQCIPRTEGPLSSTPGCACSTPGDSSSRFAGPLGCVALVAIGLRKILRRAPRLSRRT